uniref:Ubiquitin associated protein 2a n=1 Tax=Dicentrarchus labrax TaxID=13489 RepID=A0A8C4IMG6_DICLA
MMSSLGSDKARVPREKALPAATHTSQPQKQIQATAEQIRLAQMIYDKNDADFEDKVNQLMEVTGKNQDECMVALHDCNEDVSRAINFLLESTSDMTSWETVGKKKPLVKEGPSESKENKENREKKGEREVSKGRTAANRKGKAASRSRQGTQSKLHIHLNLLQSPLSLLSTFEDWAAEDWSEDLSETKVFTSSCAPADGHGAAMLVCLFFPRVNVGMLWCVSAGEFGLQPEPSLVLSQLVQRHTGPSLPLARQPSPPSQQVPPASASPAPQHASTPAQAGPVMAAAGAKLPAPGAGLDPQGSSTPQQQRAQLKGPKRRIPPTSKIPSTAVEMPGSADVPGLNLQFGALDFGSESALPEFGVVDNCVSAASRESTPAPASAPPAPGPGTQSQTKPVYHSSSVALPSLTSSSLGTANSTNPPSSSSAASTSSSSVPSSSHFSTVGGSYDGTMPPHTRLAFSQSKEATGPVMVGRKSRQKCSSYELLLFLHMKGSDGCCIIVLSGKAPPNLSQGVPPLLPNQYIMGPGGLLPAYPIYGYEDLHMLQSRLPMDYYGITFPGPTATLSGRDGSLANNPYSGEVTKFGRNDSTSPAPPTSLAPQGQPQHHSSQQAFLPPGYSYTGLPYYPGVPGAVPSAAAFQYGPTMFVPPGAPGPASAKQHSMGLGLGNPSASPFQQQTQQQPSGYGQHTFSSGYEELTAGPAGVDYSKGYNSSSQAQAKSAATGPGKGVSVTSSNSGVPDISGSVYNKTQSFDKQGFHAGTPPPFSLPSALGGPGPLNPGAAPGGYAPAPFLHILPHQQPHSQLLHHHLAQDGQGGPNQRGQSSSMQQKSQVNKSSYGSSPYWAN